MKTRSKLVGRRGITFAVAVIAILFAGINVTRAAAQAAIPGDALYSVKTAIEQSRLALASDAGERASMKLDFAEERLKEIAALIDEGRISEIGSTVLAFEENINAAIIELEILAELDPGQAAAIAAEITSALTRYAQELSRILLGAPESVRAAIIRALDTAELAGSLELPGTGFSSDDNANDNGNDNGDDNGNDNGNDNDNGDDNGNDANDNGDDNGNDANYNGDDNGNDANNNGDDNGNDANNNGDEYGNENANTNGNDNNDDRGGSGGNGSGGSGGGGNSDD